MFNVEYQRWLNSSVLTDEERAELLSIANNEEAKALRFTAPMDFGTAGLRSTMYMGIGSMNRYTVAQTTRGIAALIKSVGGEDRSSFPGMGISVSPLCRSIKPSRSVSVTTK